MSDATMDRVLFVVPSSGDRPDAERLAYWLAFACRTARETAEVSMTAISNVAGVEKSTVSLYEKNGRWPRDPEGMVAAYARAINLRDSRELWQIAFNLWVEHGDPPQITDRRVGDPPTDLAAEIERAVTKMRDAS